MAPDAAPPPSSPAEAWRALGLPTTRLEAWRYFPLRALEGLDLASAASGPAPALPPGFDVVVADGRLVSRPDASHPLASAVAVMADDGRGPASAEAFASGLEAANAAFAPETVLLRVPSPVVGPGGTRAGGALSAPLAAPTLRVALVTSHGATSHPRLRVSLAAGAQLRLFLAVTDAGATLQNADLALDLAPDAHLELVILASGAARGLSVSEVHATLGARARLEAFAATTRVKAEAGASGRSSGSAPGASEADTPAVSATRVAFTVRLAGPEAEARVDGLYLPRGASRLDHRVHVTHAARNTRSFASWAGAVDDRATGTFLGEVDIGADVPACVTRQLTRTLLLSPQASAQAKPELRIACDDVTASHGATTGTLDARQHFYLTSRGLSPEDARALLVAAFLREALGRAPAFARADLEVHLGLAAVTELEGADDDDLSWPGRSSASAPGSSGDADARP